MREHVRLSAAAASLSLFGLFAVADARAQFLFPVTNRAAPTVFQAAGPTASSIQSSVDQFRVTVGEPNNGNQAGPLAEGRREINWDGGGSTATAVVPTPFDGFLVNRGARFTTPGTGFVQATPAGLAETFNNPSYENIFTAFSPARLFSPIGSNITEAEFFVPGPGGGPATTNGFGAVFTDVDQPDGSQLPWWFFGGGSARIECYGVNGHLLFSGFVPSSPGSGSLSFLGVVFEEAVIARVRIITGTVAPGPNDGIRDIVVMDDFIYGEPQPQ